MIVRTFCGQSVFSWLLSHSVWQRVKHFSFTCLLLIIFCLFDCFFNWSDWFINVLISGSPPGYFENHSMCSAHKNHWSHLLYMYAYFLGVGDMGRILIQSPGSFRFCRNAQASSLWEATRNNKCEYVLGTFWSVYHCLTDDHGFPLSPHNEVLHSKFFFFSNTGSRTISRGDWKNSHIRPIPWPKWKS